MTGPTGGESSSDEVEIDEVLSHLENLEETIESTEDRREIKRVRRMLEQVPGGKSVEKQIEKYTTRDVAEGIVGGIIFSLPLLVEDGVFEIAEWFVEFSVGPLPIFLVVNVVFIMAVTAGLLYYTDIRDVKRPNPLFGIIPRRLVGVLIISFLVAASMMYMWGRLHEEDPTTLEVFARISVIWAAAAFGATLGDILPGESKGQDITELIAEIGDTPVSDADAETDSNS